jgi:hypothetical protein
MLVLAVPTIAATPIGVGGGRDQRGGAERGYCSKCEDGFSEHVELLSSEGSSPPFADTDARPLGCSFLIEKIHDNGFMLMAKM